MVFSLQLQDLKITEDGLQKEIEFYFGKLRDIEITCQENENEEDPVIERILEVLYATEVSTV
jgi:RP/EB family microtubule-associated protein